MNIIFPGEHFTGFIKSQADYRMFKNSMLISVHLNQHWSADLSKQRQPDINFKSHRNEILQHLSLNIYTLIHNYNMVTWEYTEEFFCFNLLPPHLSSTETPSRSHSSWSTFQVILFVLCQETKIHYMSNLYSLSRQKFECSNNTQHKRIQHQCQEKI
jgi:hypothetical protein